MQDEPLSTGGRTLWPMWLRILLVLLLVAAGGYAIAREKHRSPTAARQTPSPISLAASAPAQAWPHVAGGCGSDVQLPSVSRSPLTIHTGVRLLMGGSALRIVDVDTGRVTAVPGVALVGDESVTELASSGSDAYALTARCQVAAAGRVVKISANQRAEVVATGQFDALLADDRRVWVEVYPTNDTTLFELRRLSGAPPPFRWLRNGLFVDAVAGDWLVARRPSAAPSGPDTGPLVLLLDARNGKVIDDLGAGYPLAAGAGVLVWSDVCPQGSSCTLHSRPLIGQTRRSYRLPAGRNLSALGSAVMSPDGQLLAFALQRAAPDPRYDPGHPLPPSDLAVLHLDSGQLQLVPGLELAPKSPAGYAFSADSRWLVIALNEGVRTRLLVWQPGSSKPMQSPAELPGKLATRPPIVVLR